VLTEYASWRWCLYVNIPIAICAVLAAIPVLKESKVEAAPLRHTGSHPRHFRSRRVGLGLHPAGRTRLALDQHLAGWSSRVAADRVRAGGAAFHQPAAADAHLENATGGCLHRRPADRRRVVRRLSIPDLLPARDPGYTPIQAGFAFLPFSFGVVVGAGIGSQLTIRVGPRVVVPAACCSAWPGCSGVQDHRRHEYMSTILPAMLLISVGMASSSCHHQPRAGRHQPRRRRRRQCRGQHRPAGRRVGGHRLLNTIAATATASFLLSNPPHRPEAIGRAGRGRGGGFGTAFMWAAVIFGIATVVSLVLINAGKHRSRHRTDAGT